MRSTYVIKSHILFIILITVIIAVSTARALPPNWTVTQLTDNDSNDLAPIVSGANIAWHSLGAGQYSLWIYYGTAEETVLLAEDDESFADRYDIDGPRGRRYLDPT